MSVETTTDEELIQLCAQKFVDNVAANVSAQGVPANHPEVIRQLEEAMPGVVARFARCARDDLEAYAAVRH
jgi:hypothetical protein